LLVDEILVDSLMITNIIITLYEFNSKVERQFVCFTDSVRWQQE